LDPLSLREMTLTAWSFYQVRRFEEAINKAQQIIELDRTYPQGHFQLGNVLLEVGEAEKGLASIQEAAELMGDAALPMSMLCFALVAAGKREAAEAVRNELLTLASTRYVKEYFLATAHLALGYRDEALTSLEKAAAERDPWLVWLGTETKLDPLRNEPRFIEAFRSTNNPMAFV